MEWLDFLFPIYRWLNTPFLRDNMFFEPKYKKDQNHCYGEAWTGLWWKQMYELLPTDAKGRKPLPIVLIPESDKTHLSHNGTNFGLSNANISTGKQYAHRVVLTLGNWPEHIQHQPLAREDVAYLPDLDKQDVSIKSHRPFCRVLLFHRCWEKMLANFDQWKDKGTLCFFK